MVPRVDIIPAVLFLSAIVAPALLPSKFDTKDSVYLSSPKDTEAVWLRSSVDCGGCLLLEHKGCKSTFINDGRNKVLSMLILFFGLTEQGRSKEARRGTMLDKVRRHTEFFC